MTTETWKLLLDKDFGFPRGERGQPAASRLGVDRWREEGRSKKSRHKSELHLTDT
jgi:hypothetical protein